MVEVYHIPMKCQEENKTIYKTGLGFADMHIIVPLLIRGGNDSMIFAIRHGHNGMSIGMLEDRNYLSLVEDDLVRIFQSYDKEWLHSSLYTFYAHNFRKASG